MPINKKRYCRKVWKEKQGCEPKGSQTECCWKEREEASPENWVSNVKYDLDQNLVRICKKC
jgi:hypothetical protein